MRSPGELGSPTDPITNVLPSVDMVDKLAAEALPGFIAHLAALQARAAARMVTESLQRDGHEEDAEDRYLDVPEIAKTLNVTEQFVYTHLIKTGDLPAIEFGKKAYKRVRVADLRAWAAQHRIEIPWARSTTPERSGGTAGPTSLPSNAKRRRDRGMHP